MTTLFDKATKVEITWLVRFESRKCFAAGAFCAETFVEHQVTRGPFDYYEDAVEFAETIRTRKDTVGLTYVFPRIRKVGKRETSCD